MYSGSSKGVRNLNNPNIRIYLTIEPFINNKLNTPENSNVNKSTPSGDSSRRKKGLKTGHKINLVLVVITALAFAWGIFSYFMSSPNLCKTLKQREQQVAIRIEHLKKSKENSTDEDFDLKYYDFEINHANAELQNIKDSLKLCSN